MMGLSHFRGIRGDGNCYYRSVAYGFIELLVMKRKVAALETLIERFLANVDIFCIGDSHYLLPLVMGIQEFIEAIESK